MYALPPLVNAQDADYIVNVFSEALIDALQGVCVSASPPPPRPSSTKRESPFPPYVPPPVPHPIEGAHLCRCPPSLHSLPRRLRLRHSHQWRRSRCLQRPSRHPVQTSSCLRCPSPLIYGEQHVNNEIQGFCVSSESISISSLDYEVKRISSPSLVMSRGFEVRRDPLHRQEHEHLLG